MAEPRAESAHFIFGNERVELKIDGGTGFVRDIFSKETGLHHKAELSGIWPFGLRMGDGYAPDLLRVQVDASDACADQEMTYEIASTPGGRALRMTYDNMLTTGGFPSGIRLTVNIALDDGADYFLITADVENHGKYDITNIFSGWGGLVAGSDRAAERLVKLFGLNALEAAELPRLGKGDAILIRKIAGKGDVHIPIYIPLPPHRQALYTTDPRERDREHPTLFAQEGPP